MTPRPSWRAYLRLSLVSVPVQAFNAVETRACEVHLHQLHAACHSRIRYEKVCPIHGKVPNDEIVSGYEYAKDQYVVIDPAELDKLRPESDKAIQIEAFVPPEAIDPIYLDGRTYYLAPDGSAGHRRQGTARGRADRAPGGLGRNRPVLSRCRPMLGLFSGRFFLFEPLISRISKIALCYVEPQTTMNVSAGGPRRDCGSTTAGRVPNLAVGRAACGR